jgi:hypothetical protein
VTSEVLPLALSLIVFFGRRKFLIRGAPTIPSRVAA